jgi:hypothetical protein
VDAVAKEEEPEAGREALAIGHRLARTIEEGVEQGEPYGHSASASEHAAQQGASVDLASHHSTSSLASSD